METNRVVPAYRRRRFNLFSIYNTLLSTAVMISVVGLYSFSQRMKVETRLPTTGNVLLEERSRLDASSSTHGPATITAQTGLPMDVGMTKNITRLVYNRVGKCGSRTLLAVIEKTSHWNKFNNAKSREYHGRILDNSEEAELVDEIMNLTPPFLYNRHIDYVDFERHNVGDAPMYINLIRDPVDRKISSFYYLRFGDMQQSRESTKRDLNVTFEECVLEEHDECRAGMISIIPYFCGQSDRCREDGEWALATAKRNVVEKYVFVGILGHFERSLRVFRYLLPQFFRLAPKAYKIIQKKDAMAKFKSRSRKEAPDYVKQIMKERMPLDYEFYNFVEERMLLIEKQIEMAESKAKKLKKTAVTFR